MSGLDIPGQKATAILLEMGQAMFDRVPERAMAVLLDGTFPGSLKLTGLTQWEKFQALTDPADLPLLLNPDYLKDYQAGLAPAPVSPKWLAAISLPPLFKLMRTDFVRLYHEYGEGGERP